MPRVSAIIDLFLRRAGLSNDQKAALRSDLGAEAAGTAAALLPTRTVRYDAAQTPLDSTQLAQFLDNLGRDGSNVLDLGDTVLQATEFQGERLLTPLGYTCDVVNGRLRDYDDNIIIDWGAGILSAVGLFGGPVASWGNDTENAVGWFDVTGEYRVNGASGYTGSFFNDAGDELVIAGGIITDVIAGTPL